jgi:hypothetical protein
MSERRRLRRERRTMEAMVELFCSGMHHQQPDACGDCGELLAYARQRIEKCPYQKDKPPCAKCPIHCYQPKRREQIQAVMRYSGPRMMLRHPLFALRHWLDGFKKAPEGKRNR